MNQYPPGPGIGELRIAIAQHQARFWGMAVDPATEVLVTAGATEAIAATVLALCDPGDEILAFEPTYDSYTAVAAMAGARLRPVTLAAPRLRGGRRRAGGARQRPNAPAAAQHAAQPDRQGVHRRRARGHRSRCAWSTTSSPSPTRCTSTSCSTASTARSPRSPGMAERTLTISSAGKTFSFTGWKIGWVCGPEELVTAVRTAKQFITYVNGAPFQPAIAVGLGLGDDFYAQLADDAAGQARRALRRVAIGGLRRVRAAGHLLRDRRHPLRRRR